MQKFKVFLAVLALTALIVVFYAKESFEASDAGVVQSLVALLASFASIKSKVAKQQQRQKTAGNKKSQPASSRSPVPAPAAAPAATPAAASRFGPIPGYVLQTLGLDAEQMSNILSIINGIEQSNVDWTKTDKGTPIWSYCSNIGDGRGMTIGIAGFTSRDGSAQALADAYAPGGAPDPKQGFKLLNEIPYINMETSISA